MNDKDKVKVENIYASMPEALELDDHVEHADDSSDKILVKKGFPLEIKVFWWIIGLFFIIKLFHFLWFDVPLHKIFKRQLNTIQILEYNAQYKDALKIHESLMQQCTCYKDSYYLDIACCYFSLQEENYVWKGLELLKDKKLSERDFFTIKSKVSDHVKYYFDMLVTVYKNTKDNSKTYVFELDNLES